MLSTVQIAKSASIVEQKATRRGAREGSRSLVSSLVDVSSGGVVGSEHGDDTVRETVGSSDVRSLSTDVVDVETDSSGRLGDEGARLERVVDSFN